MNSAKKTRQELDSALYRRRMKNGVRLPCGESINGTSYIMKQQIIAVLEYYGIKVIA